MSARHHPLSRPVILSEKERKGDRVRRMPRQSSAWSSKLRSGGVVSVVWVQLFADFSAVQLTSWTVLLPWGQDPLSLPPLYCCLLLSSSPSHLSFSLHLFIYSSCSLFTLTTHRIFRTSHSPPANTHKNVCRYDE